MDWYYNMAANGLSLGNFNKLQFNCNKEAIKLDAYRGEEPIDIEEGHIPPGLPFPSYSGWRVGRVNIPLPSVSHKRLETDAPTFLVEEIWYRSALSAVKDDFQDTSFYSFHLKPFKQFWEPAPREPIQRIYGEVYMSDQMLEMEKDVRVRTPLDYQYKVVAVAIMQCSDRTLLTHFGDRSLWLAYVSFGNRSKYRRTAPSNYVMNHILYVPSVSDAIKEYYKEVFQCAATDEVLCFAKRELVQLVWALILLDLSFVDAYLHRKVEHCTDGMLRLLFPRLFARSANYVEKALLVSIKFLSEHLCPQCLTKKDHIYQLGTQMDCHRQIEKAEDGDSHREAVESARQEIFLHGMALTNNLVTMVAEKASDQLDRNTFIRIASSTWGQLLRSLMIQLKYWKRQKGGGQQQLTRQPNRGRRGEFSKKWKAGDETGLLPKPFNMSTFKNHMPTHYPYFIKMYGSLDSYSTQMGEREHIHTKRLYNHTNKKNHELQMTMHHRHSRMLHSLCTKRRFLEHHKVGGGIYVIPDKEKTGPGDLQDTFHMSTSERYPLQLFKFVDKYQDNPAVKNFYDSLQACLLYHMLNLDRDEVLDQRTLNLIRFLKNRIYTYKMYCLHYNTYDLRRKGQTVSLRTHPDIMMLVDETTAKETEHPYQYARVIGVFHTNVWIWNKDLAYKDMTVQRVQFLWVRWYELDITHCHGWKVKRLPKSCPGTFLEPAFQEDSTDGLSEADAASFGVLQWDSVARVYETFYRGKLWFKSGDWLGYYVNMHCGGGVRHSTRLFMGQMEAKATVKDQAFPVYDYETREMVKEPHGEAAVNEVTVQYKSQLNEVYPPIDDSDLDDVGLSSDNSADSVELVRQYDSNDNIEETLDIAD
ncbi:hypothetical protein V5O48_004064 [Marasmius crinis-equi]|uniref:Uncharacterized protein n=1 Tax=Marasmius crinis-equi TaxID=585013 RepID=A0ABR3FR61_9AGAR